MGNLLKLFINPINIPRKEQSSAYLEQVHYLKHVWNEDTYGFERLVRLLQSRAQLQYRSLLIQDAFGRYGKRYR